MLNQIVLIGRLTKNPELVSLDSGKQVCEATLAVRRSFKNQDGKYDTDFIKVSVWEGLAQSFQSYAEKGSLVAIKGRIQPSKYDVSNDKYILTNNVIAEKITYL